ncbi:hypothetical protein MMC29_007397 [Sticta canariensis]|nr:hypothetical protein [Sticta canariensis]
MESHIIPNSMSTGFPIALLVCIVVAVTAFLVLMAIALRHYLLRRRHQELRDRTPRSAIYIARINPKVNPPLQPPKRPCPTFHPRTLTPPVLPQLRLHSPFTASRPSIPAQPKHGVVPTSRPLRSSNSDRAPNHLAVPISSFSRHKDLLTRMPSNRMNGGIIPTAYDDKHRPGEDEDDDKRERREVVNEFFAAVVGKREREPSVQMGRWRASTRERAILASYASTVSLAGSATPKSTVEDAEKPPPLPVAGRGWGRNDDDDDDGWVSGQVGGVGRWPADGVKMDEEAHYQKQKSERHGLAPAPLAVVRQSGEMF